MTLRLFSIIFLTTVLVGVNKVDGSMRPGGTSEEKAPTAEVQAIITSIKPQVEAELGRTVPQLKLLSYKTQVVAGINYFAKVDIGEEDVVHLRVYKDLGQNVSLHSVQHSKGRTDPIEYF